MYISNEANKNKIKYIDNKPTMADRKQYYNTCNLDLLIYELCEVRGVDETIQYLQKKLKYYKALKKEAQKEDE